MIQHTTKGPAGLARTATLDAECGGDLFPLFHMPVRNAGRSVEPGDGCRGIPHPGAIRFDLPSHLCGASTNIPFSDRSPKRIREENNNLIPHLSTH